MPPSVGPVRFESLESARAAWEPLAKRAGNPFATYEFAATWWRYFGDGRPLRLEVVDDGEGEPFALLPLFVAEDGEPLTLRLLGHLEGDLLGPICDPRHRVAALEAINGVLGPGPVRLIADDVAAGTAEILGGSVEATMASPVLAMPPGGWQGLLTSLSANHRASIRRKERRLMKRGRVEIREADEGTLDRDFATLLRLHEGRFGERSRVYEGAHGEFHADFAAEAARRGWLRLRILEVDGAAVAVNYALRYGGDEWFWQSGRDLGWVDASVGSVLTAHCLRACAEEGVSRYRWLRGDETYKYRWATGDEPVETVRVERP